MNELKISDDICCSLIQFHCLLSPSPHRALFTLSHRAECIVSYFILLNFRHPQFVLSADRFWLLHFMFACFYYTRKWNGKKHRIHLSWKTCHRHRETQAAEIKAEKRTRERNKFPRFTCAELSFSPNVTAILVRSVLRAISLLLLLFRETRRRDSEKSIHRSYTNFSNSRAMDGEYPSTKEQFAVTATKCWEVNVEWICNFQLC